MALLVELDGDQYLADVGFGDSFTAPLQLFHTSDQAQDGRIYRIQRDADTFTVMARNSAANDGMKPSFKFSAKPCYPSDFDEMCTYHQTSASPILRGKKSVRAQHRPGELH